MTAEKGPFAFISEVTALGLDVFRHYPTKFRKRVNKPLHRPISTKKKTKLVLRALLRVINYASPD